MAAFFIEMGQGILAPGYDPRTRKGDLRVTTSNLYSCALIGGYNVHTGWAGAFHYPAGELSSITPEEVMWKTSYRGYDSEIEDLDWSLGNLAEIKRRVECGVRTIEGLLSWIQTLRPTACTVMEGRMCESQDMDRLRVFLEGHGRIGVKRLRAAGGEVAMRSSSDKPLKVALLGEFLGPVGFHPRLDVQYFPTGRHYFTDPQKKFILVGHNVTAKIASWGKKRRAAKRREEQRAGA
ncbi:hypothetical protein [Variovorax sp. YR566]|uniref:hypothetical protein n=1 Tax=Variovorax sp. YR566 TaxID=3450237 RepID=UPI003F80E7A0